MKNIIFIILCLTSIVSCQNREWNNPFDADCPSEYWTPTDFTAVQQGSSIKLTWNQSVNNITDFHIERNVGGTGTDWTTITIDKNSNFWIDTDITGGIDHLYRIFAEAGNNMSDSQYIQIKPILSATLSTSQANKVTYDTAILGSVIISDGGAHITEWGICWATSISPTIDSNKYVIGDEAGKFSGTFTGFEPNTTYYVRAYAINSFGIAYGNQVMFTTLTPTLATITTASATNITSESAVLGGELVSDGGSPVTEQGVCFSTNQNPTITNTKIIMGIGIGTFGGVCTGLLVDATYYVRAYAINGKGIAYGNQISFLAWGPVDAVGYGIVTDIEGNVYHTVRIGTQEWMADNLKTTKYRNGDPIPNFAINSESQDIGIGAYCFYNNDAVTLKEIFGALYNWAAVADSRNIAPVGWHVPSYSELSVLIDYAFINYDSNSGGAMKSTSSYWATPNLGANNATGFGAIPSGYFYDTIFKDLGFSFYMWSSTPQGNVGGEAFMLKNSSPGIGAGYWDGSHYFSVRCIHD